jgi:hypothetical protein
MDAVREWSVAKASDPNVQHNLPLLIRYRPEGLPPYLLDPQWLDDVGVKDKEISDDEIECRMTVGIRRALTTPRSPTKELIGKTERARSQSESREIRRRREKPKAL